MGNSDWDRGGIVVDSPEWLGYDVDNKERFMDNVEKPPSHVTEPKDEPKPAAGQPVPAPAPSSSQ